MGTMTIMMDRDKLNLEMLRATDNSLPRILRYMNTSIPFVGLVDGEVIACCLVEPREGYYDVVALAVDPDRQGQGYGRQMLAHVLDYLKQNGARYVDIGCGNADLRLFAMFQRAGFRVIGVWVDYYLGDSVTAQVINSIVNRDMIRMRADFLEKKLSSTGFDASGRS